MQEIYHWEPNAFITPDTTGNFISKSKVSLPMTSVRKSDSFFHCNASERAVFEAGIKLGGLYHQFIGVPVSIMNVECIERAIEDALKAQPFVKSIHVNINRKMLEERCGGQGEIGGGYTTLAGEMLDVKLSVAYHGKMAVCCMKYVEELDYPLMYVECIEDICPDEECKI